MPVADPIPTALDIPCGHCGFVVGVPITRLPDDGWIACPDCLSSIPVYLIGLREDIIAAYHALACFRANQSRGEAGA